MGFSPITPLSHQTNTYYGTLLVAVPNPNYRAYISLHSNFNDIGI